MRMDRPQKLRAHIAEEAGSGEERQAPSGLLANVAPSGSSTKRSGKMPARDGPEKATSNSAANGDPLTAKLSAKAVAFSPSNAAGHAGRLSDLTGNSEAEARPVIVSSTGHSFAATRPAAANQSTQQPIGTPSATPSPMRSAVGWSSDLGTGITVPGGHYVKIADLAPRDVAHAFGYLCEEHNWEKRTRTYSISPNGDGRLTAWLCFDDMRDAANAIDEVRLVIPTSTPVYVTQAEFAKALKKDTSASNKKATKMYDGQLMLQATFIGGDEEYDPEGLYYDVAALCDDCGEFTRIEQYVASDTLHQFRVEFWRIQDAEYVIEVAGADHTTIKGWSIVAKEIPATGFQVQSATGRTAWTLDVNGNQIPAAGARQAPKISSVTAGTSLVPAGRRFQGRGSDPAIPTLASSMLGAPLMQRSGTWPSAGRPSKTFPYGKRTRMPVDGPNRIYPDRVEAGIDVRTSIMVRNLPSEMDATQFKEVVDRVCFGRYDFYYLRIDFTTGKNVGYAFVNFCTPSDLLAFFHAYNGKEYIEGFGRHPILGPRLGMLAYATCQGQDCAIEKFRNSSVMDEFPGYRPRLFWSYQDAEDSSMVGTERPFPEVNNKTKHARSKWNAGEIGLYAPKSRNGAVIGRNSQYDRGTPAQMQEDATFNQQMMQAFPSYNNGYVWGNQQMGASMPMHMNMNMNMNMGMPVAPYSTMYPGGNQFHSYHHAPNNMYGGPNGFTPAPPTFYSTAGPAMQPAFYNNTGPMMQPGFHGSPGPMNGNGFYPSRLRTISKGRLGQPARRHVVVRPERDLETAEREIEEGLRLQAEYDELKAVKEQMEAAQAAAAARGAEVPRFISGEGHQGAGDEQNGYAADEYAGNGYTADSGFVENGQYDDGYDANHN